MTPGLSVGTLANDQTSQMKGSRLMKEEKRTSQVLEGTSREGDFVLRTQALADKEGYRNVSKAWFNQTKTLDHVIEETIRANHDAETFCSGLTKLEPVVGPDGNFCLADLKNDRLLNPDSHSLKQLLQLFGVATTFGSMLAQSRRDGDAEMLVKILNHQIRFMDSERRYLLRVRDQIRLTGIMQESARRFRNEWYLNTLKRILPDARASHWKGTDDTTLGNVLVPDTIREEADSEYGALISISNCEVLSHPFRQRPSVFRAICMNGCIWGEEKGKEFTLSSFGRGEIDLAEAEKLIAENIQDQIPLVSDYVDQMLTTRDLRTDVSMKPVIAQFCRDARINKRKASAILRGWNIEQKETPEYGPTLFGLINGVTRAAQFMNTDGWVEFDELGGRLAQYNSDLWSSLTLRASRLGTKEVTKAFAKWTPSTN